MISTPPMAAVGLPVAAKKAAMCCFDPPHGGGRKYKKSFYVFLFSVIYGIIFIGKIEKYVLDN
jgi:hypothetical protein